MGGAVAVLDRALAWDAAPGFMSWAAEAVRALPVAHLARWERVVNGTWWLTQGDTRIGELRQYAIDQPTFLCRFIPGPGWEGVRALFESWAALRGPDTDGSRTAQAIKPIMDLGLTLVAEDEGRPMALFRECIVRIDGDTARVRR
ncbi:hypothetical protein [Streptomyces sp. NPDC007205]|uniref:hypothetical protein n=1 Tax=Streptomyces sp. NPDC007205 TaxID=3154316 RepID=UPI00340712E9